MELAGPRRSGTEADGMKSKITWIAIAMMWAAMASAAGMEGLGVGIIVGEPTGLSLKKWIRPRHAIDAAAAWSFSENDSFQFHADYLIHHFGITDIRPDEGRVPFYLGVGGRVKLKERNEGRGRNDHDTLVGLRIPFGVAWLFAKAPVELFAEIVPILDVVPDTNFDINGAIGARYYFR
jgi:hypothetical protein